MHWLLAMVVVTAGCQKLKPETVAIPDYPDLSSLYQDQVVLLGSKAMTKEVALNEKKEVKTIQMDSAAWRDELSFLEDINPNQSEYVGVFDKSTNGDETSLTLKAGEKGILKSLILTTADGIYTSIQATVFEDKDVYIHSRDIALSFDNGVLASYQIEGYQRMLFSDTVRFSIRGKVE